MTDIDFDPGPPPELAEHFAAVPGYPADKQALFWYAWGPVFYRGRLDKSARLLGIALEGEAQIILADTPGIFLPRRRLDRAMVSAAWEGAEAADAIVLLVDSVKLRRHELDPLLEALAPA